MLALLVERVERIGHRRKKVDGKKRRETLRGQAPGLVHNHACASGMCVLKSTGEPR